MKFNCTKAFLFGCLLVFLISPISYAGADQKTSACGTFYGFQSSSSAKPKYPVRRLSHKSRGKDLILTWQCPEGKKAYVGWFCCSCKDNTSHHEPASTPDRYVITGEPGDYSVSVSCHEPGSIVVDGVPIAITHK